MNFEKIIEFHEKYGTSVQMLKDRSDFKDIFDNVVIAPMWKPSMCFNIDEKYITKVNDRLYNVESDTYKFSFVSVGMMGASNTMDVVLECLLFNPKAVLFVGSASSLNVNIKIGDTVLVEKSFCGEGASRYLNDDLHDDFGEYLSPSHKLNFQIENILRKNNIDYFLADCFCASTIFSQFSHIDYVKSFGCDILEMESYCAFKACQTRNVPVSAIINISDSMAMCKSLFSGRTSQEKKIRDEKRKNVITKVVTELFMK